MVARRDRRPQNANENWHSPAVYTGMWIDTLAITASALAKAYVPDARPPFRTSRRRKRSSQTRSSTRPSASLRCLRRRMQLWASTFNSERS